MWSVIDNQELLTQRNQESKCLHSQAYMELIEHNFFFLSRSDMDFRKLIWLPTYTVK